MPKGITEISYFLFYHCTNLKSINIPRGVTKIGYCSFGDCTSLKSISIPDALESIIWSSFIYCTNLTTIYANSDSYASSYPWRYGTVDTKTGYTEGSLIINTKVNAEAKIAEASKALLSYTTAGGLETDAAYKDVATTLSKYSTSELIEAETDMAKLTSWITELDGKIQTLNNTEIKPLELTINSFESNVASPQNVGTEITLSSTSSGGTGILQSKFVAFDGRKYVTIKNYSTQATATWKPTKPGTYTIFACVMDTTGKIERKTMTYVIKAPLAINSFKANVASPQKVGTAITLSSTSSGGTGTLQSKFVAFDGTTYTTIKNYSTQATATWKPTKPGTYTIFACVMDTTGKIERKTITYVIKAPLAINSFKANVASPQKIGTIITLSSTSSGGTGILQNKFVVFDGIKYLTLKDYSTVATTTWKPTKSGTYTIFACVMDATGTIERKSINYEIK